MQTSDQQLIYYIKIHTGDPQQPGHEADHSPPSSTPRLGMFGAILLLPINLHGAVLN